MVPPGVVAIAADELPLPLPAPAISEASSMATAIPAVEAARLDSSSFFSERRFRFLLRGGDFRGIMKALRNEAALALLTMSSFSQSLSS